MTLENAVNHSGHGEHSEKQGFDTCFPTNNEVRRASVLKLKHFAVAAVAAVIAVVELRLLG